MVMEPYDPEMFPDAVTFHRSTATVSDQGAADVTLDEEGEAMAASVQRNTVTGTDAQGRAFTTTVHSVRTDADVDAQVGDEFRYTPAGSDTAHVLTVTGHTEPGGIGDVIWITPCLEVR
jgi:hypothetical protein